MGFASKISNAQMSGASNSGVYGGAPPTGYTGGPPSAPSPAGGYKPQQSQQPQQYQAYPGGSPSPLHPETMSRPWSGQGYPPPPGPPSQLRPGPGPSPSPHPQYQAYPPVPPNKPSPSPAYSGPPPQAYSPASYSPHTPQPQAYSPAPPMGGAPYGPGPQSYAPTPPPQPYGAPGPNYPPQPPPAGYSPQPHNAPYPGGPPGPSPGPGSRPPPGPPGQFGPPGGAPGGAGPATPQQLDAYRQLLISTIQEKNLQAFYPPDKLDRLVQGLSRDGPTKVQRIVSEFSLPIEIAMDVIKLSLYDIVLYVDDSGSIEFEEKGVRKEQLKQILGIVATVASTFDEDGINLRFMNNDFMQNNIRNAQEVEQVISNIRFSGMTPLGSALRTKVIDPMIVAPARAGRLQKPVLVISITDGQPAGEPQDSVSQGIRYAVDEVSRTPLGRGAVAFQFSQVGNDTKARDFLGSLDNDPSIGNLIDCTSNFEVEQDEMMRANPPVHLTRELWCAKLMLGSIDSSYDTKDERGSGAPAPPGPPPGQYGGYSQPGYGSQPPAPAYGTSAPYNPGQQSPYPPPGGPPPGQYGGGGYSQPGYPPQPGYPSQSPAPGYGSSAPYSPGQPAPYPPSSQGPPPGQYGGYSQPAYGQRPPGGGGGGYPGQQPPYGQPPRY